MNPATITNDDEEPGLGARVSLDTRSACGYVLQALDEQAFVGSRALHENAYQPNREVMACG
jgi:hypothetical protein